MSDALAAAMIGFVDTAAFRTGVVELGHTGRFVDTASTAAASRLVGAR